MLNTVEYERMLTNLGKLELRTRDFHTSLRVFQARRPAALPKLRQEFAPSLTDRERDILRLIAAGRENTEIAALLHFGLGTIKMHVRDILAKLGVSSRTEAAVLAVKYDLL